MKDWVFIAVYTVFTSIFIWLVVFLFFQNLEKQDEYDRWSEACQDRRGSVMEWSDGQDACVQNNKKITVPEYKEFQSHGI